MNSIIACVKRFRILGLLMASLCLFVLSFLLLTQSPKLLLRKSVLLDHEQSDSTKILLSRTEALILQEEPCPATGNLHQNTCYGVSTKELASFATVVNPQLSAWFNSLPRIYNFKCSPSADGQFLLLWQDSSNIHGSAIAPLNMSYHQEFWRGYTPNYYAGWMQGMHQWVECMWGESAKAHMQIVVHDEDRRTARQKTISFVLPEDFGQTISSVRLVDEAHLVATNWNADANNALARPYLLHYDIVPQKPQVKLYKPNLPQGCQIVDMVLAPDGKQIAWLLAMDKPPSLTARLARMFHINVVEANHCVCLGVTDEFGKVFREIGSISNSDENSTPITDMQWLPSGNEIAYHYASYIYLVEIPR